jgi:hypothetical protein
MALILARERPLLEVRDGQVVPGRNRGSELVAALEEAGPAITRAIRATGRIELDDHPHLTWTGCGFLAGPGLVVTAGHVADTIFPSGSRGTVRHGPVLRLGERMGEGPAHRIVGCLNRHPVLDLAVLEIEGDTYPEALSLEPAAPEPEGQAAAVVAYFTEDPRNDTTQVRQLGEFEVGQKVVAPGRLLGHSVDRYHDRGTWSLTHDCTTLGGAAGAPVVNLGTGNVQGCHFGGRFEHENYAVPVSELVLDPRIRSIGLSFTGPLPDPDPVAFGSAYFDAKTSVAGPGATTRLDATALGTIGKQLMAVRAGLDGALAFLRELGAPYAEVVEAQPGRGRVPDEEFLDAVLDTLNRSGLLVTEVVSQLLPDEEVVTAETVPVPGDSRRGLSDGTLDALTAVLPSDTLAYVVGSPFTAQLTGPDGTIDPLPATVRRLARSGTDEATAALEWLLRAVADRQGATEPEPLDAALDELGQHLPERPTLAEPRTGDMVDISFLSAGLAAARSVGRVRYDDAGSTGWLVAPDLVVAPAHLTMWSGRGEAPSRLVTPHDVDLTGFRVEFDADDATRPRLVVAVAAIELLDFSIDLTILRLVDRLTDRDPLQMDLDRPTSGPVAAIHFPGLGAQTLSYAGGRLLANDGHDVTYALATARGSAGAPVFNQGWRVVATHRATFGRADPLAGDVVTKLGTSVEALIGSLRGAVDTQPLWRRICGAQKALRTIDPVLLSADPALRQPAVLVVADEATEVPDIPGMSVITRTGDLLSVLVDASASRELGTTPGVVSLTASGTAMRKECRTSLPFVGVPLDRSGIDDDGDHAIVAVIDEGIDPFHEAFLDGSGRTRIDLYWDQLDGAVAADAPAHTLSQPSRELVARHDIKGGAVYLAADLDGLAGPDRARLRAGVGHGTAVASIAAGRSTGENPPLFGGGLAPGARLIVVRYDTNGMSIGASNGHLQALRVVGARATELGLPVVVNISNGMNAGAHDGSAELERACARFVDRPGRAVVKSAGNEGGAGRHAQFTVVDQSERVLRWNSTPATRPAREGATDELELWFDTYNIYSFQIQDPDRGLSPILAANAPTGAPLSNLNFLDAVYEQYATTNPSKSRLSIKVGPGQKKAVQPGVWTLRIAATKFRAEDGFHAWLEEQPGRILTFMADSVEACTITIPGTGKEVITVGAIAPQPGRALFNESSRGPNAEGHMKPDLVAPGVDIAAARAGSDDEVMAEASSGTSLAAPHVTGAIAMAFSMAHKSAASTGNAFGLNQAAVRKLLIDSSDDLKPKGSVDRGFGTLNVRAFLGAVRERLDS